MDPVAMDVAAMGIAAMGVVAMGVAACFTLTEAYLRWRINGDLPTWLLV